MQYIYIYIYTHYSFLGSLGWFGKSQAAARWLACLRIAARMQRVFRCVCSRYFYFHHSPSVQEPQKVLSVDSLQGSSVNVGMVQTRLAWPLRKDDTHTNREV